MEDQTPNTRAVVAISDDRRYLVTLDPDDGLTQEWNGYTLNESYEWKIRGSWDDTGQDAVDVLAEWLAEWEPDHA